MAPHSRQRRGPVLHSHFPAHLEAKLGPGIDEAIKTGELWGTHTGHEDDHGTDRTIDNNAVEMDTLEGIIDHCIQKFADVPCEASKHCAVYIIDDYVKRDLERFRDGLTTGRDTAPMVIGDLYGNVFPVPSSITQRLWLARLNNSNTFAVMQKNRLAFLLEEINARGKFKGFFDTTRAVQTPAEQKEYKDKIAAETKHKEEVEYIQELRGQIQEGALFFRPEIEDQDKRESAELEGFEKEFWVFAEFAPLELSQQIIVSRLCDHVSQVLQGMKYDFADGTSRPYSLHKYKNGTTAKVSHRVEVQREANSIMLAELNDPAAFETVLKRRVAWYVDQLNKQENGKFRGLFDNIDLEAQFSNVPTETLNGEKVNMRKWKDEPEVKKEKSTSESETAKPKTASQRAYRARKRNEAKKAKKAAAKEEWEDVEDDENDENKQPKIEDEDVDMTDM